MGINKKLLRNLSKKFSIATIFEKIQEDFLFNPEIKEISKMDKDPNTPMRGIPVPGRQVPGLTTSTPARTSTIPLIMQLNDSDSDDEEGVEEVEDSDNEDPLAVGDEGGEESGDENEANNEDEDNDEEEDDDDEEDEEGEGEEDSDDDEEGEEEEDEDEEEEEDKKAKGEVKRKTIMPQLTLKKLPKKTDLNSCIKPCI